MLEELQKIWHGGEGKWRVRLLGCKPIISGLPRWQLSKARQDYKVATVPHSGKEFEEATVSIARYCECCRNTYVFIEEHLLEALSSPHPYIREWGKLIQQGKHKCRRVKK